MESSGGMIGSAHSPPVSEINSCYGTTPGTALTQLSADKSHVTHGTESKDTIQPPPFALRVAKSQDGHDSLSTTTAEGSQDPFTSSKGASQARANGLKLSPMAAAFTPSRNLTSSFSDTVKYHPDFERNGQPTYARNADPTESHTDLSNLLVGGSDSSVVEQKLCTTEANAANTSRLNAVGGQPEGSLVQLPIPNRPLQTNCSQVTRHLKISNMAFGHQSEQISQMLYILKPKSHTEFTSSLTYGEVAYIHLTDIREAQRILLALQEKYPMHHAECVRREHCLTDVGSQPTPRIMQSEGEIVAVARFEGSRQSFDTQSIVALVKDILQSFGPLMTFTVPVSSHPTIVVFAAFFDSVDAQKALCLSGVKLAGCILTIGLPATSKDVSLKGATESPEPVTLRQDGESLGADIGNLSIEDEVFIEGHAKQLFYSPAISTSCPHTVPAAPLRSLYQTPPSTAQTPSSWGTTSNLSSNITGQITAPYLALWGGLNPGVIGQERIETSSIGARPIYPPQPRREAHKLRSNLDYSSGHHNVVDIERIRDGQDVRTTIMLRNIPNKIDQAMLKEIVDETSRGQYDFMYLRIDFANNCNIGYAFINFEDPWYIVDFVRSRAGRRWNRFNSDKVAEVSYATIQGKDCLVQKFRNSSVMLEHPSFRPKIFFTGTGPLSGKEDVFPGPDNPSKMRRSIENAEHVGLFAPRAGQHYRDEQRRRRSQYDRGTRLAELEDSHGTTNYHNRASFPGANYQSLRSIGSTNALDVFTTTRRVY